MSKVSRFWTRMSIICAVGAVVMIVFAVIVGQMQPLLIAGALFVLEAVIRFWKLRCPYCGWNKFLPHWFKKGGMNCPSCGRTIRYDDE